MKDTRKLNEGFLLVELLASMSVLAVILVVLGTIISATVRASERANAMSNEMEEVTRVVDAFSREVASLSPQRWAGHDAGYVFQGEPDRVAFVSARVSDLGQELKRVVLLGTKNGIFSEERLLPPHVMDVRELPAVAISARLSARFRVKFAYFEKLANGSEMLIDTWSDKSKMPSAIRITLSDGSSTMRNVRLPIYVSEPPRCGEQEDAACPTTVATTKRAEPKW